MTRDGVGIVVVSHSRALARAAIALAEEMLHGRPVRIEEAAGLEDGTLGTDAVRVADAIVHADRGRGVVVLMDLGSAVLSAELALDLLDRPLRERVILCPAPLVEGLCVAAVAAGTGADRDGVATEALRALGAKEGHLSVPAAAPGPDADGDGDGEGDGGHGELGGRFEVTWPHGLHARPAAVLVQAVREFDADVHLRDVTAGGAAVPAGSLTRVAAMAAVEGHTVEVTAAGPQARQALARVLELAASGFGDLPATAVGGAATGRSRPPSPAEDDTTADARSGPLPAAPGVAVGPAWFLTRTPESGDGDDDADDPEAEWARLRAGLAGVEKEIRRTRDHTARVAGETEASIFDAHVALLDDPELVEAARAAIRDGSSARVAWATAVAAAESTLAALPEEYLRARAADVRAVGDQVARRLRATSEASGPVETGPPSGRGVLVAPDLTPAQAATLDPERVCAVVLAGGSPTAHSAILTRALGIPTVVAAGSAVLDVAAGTPLAVDGGSGELVVDPSAQVRADFEERAGALARRRDRARAFSRAPAVTLDGLEIHVGANLASVADATAAAAAGADLAGLVRTEFVFLARSQPPDVEEQAAVYRAIAEALPGRRVVVRTLDVGGDKALDYLPAPAEANPFLGVRGIRLSLTRPELLTDQLRAIVRVAHDLPVDVMFPMVTTLAELFSARRLLDAAVRVEGRGVPAGMRVGIMVEVPATALKARVFAPHVDFLSIGTNDLTQYALAAERGNDAVAAVADPLDPGVLALVAATAAADTTVAVCGELAADERVTGLLLGLGVRELSVVPTAIAQVKQAVREVDARRAVDLAQAALAAPDGAAVRALLTA